MIDKYTDAAVKEPLEYAQENRPTVCPRVVTLGNPGKNAGVPVRIINLSAKVIRIPVKSNICPLEEVKVVREAHISEQDSATINLDPHTPKSEIKQHTNDIPPSVTLPQHHAVPEQDYRVVKEMNQDELNSGTALNTYGVDLEDSSLTEEQKQNIYNLFD